MRAFIAGIWLAVALTLVTDTRAATPGVGPDSASEPWYVKASFTPTGRTLDGFALAKSRKHWCAADFYEASRLPLDVMKAFAESNLAFSVPWEPRGLPRLLAKVGRYRKCDGQTGVFLALMDFGARRTRVHHVVEFGPGPFAALNLSDRNGLTIWWCDECDDFVEISWDVRKRKFLFRGMDDMLEDRSSSP